MAVVGGGNSAAEESLFLTKFADRVTLLVRGEALKASQVIQEKVLSHDQIDVRFHTEVDAFEGAESKLHTVKVRDNRSDTTEDLGVPGAFIFIGLDPTTAFLEGSGVRLDERGFIVTGHVLVHGTPGEPEPPILGTSVPGIFAAGDVASFPSQALGRLRVEHENAAIATGHHAGLAMAGKPQPYAELPFFYSDLFDLGYEAVGRLDSRLDIAEDWVVPNRQGVVYYLDDGHVRGVLLWMPDMGETGETIFARRGRVGSGAGGIELRLEIDEHVVRGVAAAAIQTQIATGSECAQERYAAVGDRFRCLPAKPALKDRQLGKGALHLRL